MMELCESCEQRPATERITVESQHTSRYYTVAVCGSCNLLIPSPEDIDV